MTESGMPIEERAYGQSLVRRCDAYGLLETVMEEAEQRGDLRTWNAEDVEGAWAELRELQREAKADLSLKR